MTAYQVKLEAFEGPLDLLMHLLEKNKINIYDIPIAEITAQYLSYLEQFKEFNIEIASEFLVMAATLLQIKSRMMLPKLSKPEKEVEEEIDPRQELVERLLEYRKFKEFSAMLDQLADERSKLFFRSPQLPKISYAPLRGMGITVLMDAFQAVLEAAVDETALVSREKYSVQDKMTDIMLLVRKNADGILFSDAFTRSGTREEVILTFLALLELIRMKRISVRQLYSFSPICIRLKECDTDVCFMPS